MSVVIFVVMKDREERRSRKRSAAAFLSREKLHKNADRYVRNLPRALDSSGETEQASKTTS